MMDLQNSWPADAFDAIVIRSHDTNLDIQSSDNSKIELTGESEKTHTRGIKIDTDGRQIRIVTHARSGRSRLILKLPPDKPWSVNAASGYGEIKIRDVKARAAVFIGRGYIELENYKGIITAGAGHADIRLRNFTQSAIPLEATPPTNTFPDIDDILHRRGSGWTENDWENWGLGLGERIGRWFMDLSGFFDRLKISSRDMGFNLQTGEGNIGLNGIEAGAGKVRTARGDVRVENARLTNLELNLARGNVDGKTMLQYADWMVKSVHGDVRLSLPSNAHSRFDLSTRRGKISSEFPLVRVSRQGPESYSGSRMVGTVGSNVEGTVPELLVTAVHGNIEIKSEQAADYGSSPGAVTPVAGAPPSTHEKYNTTLEVLNALREGKITVAEADELLYKLDTAGK